MCEIVQTLSDVVLTGFIWLTWFYIKRERCFHTQSPVKRDTYTFLGPQSGLWLRVYNCPIWKLSRTSALLLCKAPVNTQRPSHLCLTVTASIGREQDHSSCPLGNLRGPNRTPAWDRGWEGSEEREALFPHSICYHNLRILGGDIAGYTRMGYSIFKETYITALNTGSQLSSLTRKSTESFLSRVAIFLFHFS